MNNHSFMEGESSNMKCLELFTGAGGLAMGIGKAGFHHTGLVEFNHDACETMRNNHALFESPDEPSPIREKDVRHISDFSVDYTGINVVAGGPPCQPFSMGGKAKGPADPRDMFPQAVRAVRQTRPAAFIFENVKGLLRHAFTDYFEYIILQMNYPSVTIRENESIWEHRSRLEKIHTQGIVPDLSYRVIWQLLNAADYGIPQKRERVLMVGFRSDLCVAWNFPEPTHSRRALERDKWVTGAYFERNKIPHSKRLRPDQAIQRRAEREAPDSFLKPWMTTREALNGLPDPEVKEIPEINHVFVPGARAYPGHTGSVLDEPAKTLKAGAHGVPGGENMLSLPDGRVRYLTLREAARLQTFPDSYHFNRSWTESMRQLGNAVPVQLGYVVAQSVKSALEKA